MLDELIHSLYILQASTNAPSQQPDFWRDPIWQSAGVILSSILTLISIFISLKQRKRKVLTYEIISTENIVRIADEAVQGQLQIYYQGKEIKNLYLVTIKFTNSGNVEIKPEDYASAISLCFGSNARILAIKNIEMSSDSLNLRFRYYEDPQGQVTVLDPMLLNKKDFFTIHLLVTGYQGASVNSRIVGGEISEKTGKFTSEPLYSSTILLLVSVLLLQYGYDKISLVTLGMAFWELIRRCMSYFNKNKN